MFRPKARDRKHCNMLCYKISIGYALTSYAAYKPSGFPHDTDSKDKRWGFRILDLGPFA